jgi:hypothetical protein
MKKMFKARATNLPKYLISQFKKVEFTVFLKVIGVATLDAPLTF